MAYTHVQLAKYKVIYLCFAEYNVRLVTFKEVKTCDTVHIPCINLFVKHDALESICDFFQFIPWNKKNYFFAY